MATANGNSNSYTLSGTSCSWKATCDYPATGSGTATIKVVFSTPSGVTGNQYMGVTGYIDGNQVGSTWTGKQAIPCTHSFGSVTLSPGSHSFKVAYNLSGNPCNGQVSQGTFTIAANTYTVTYNANGGTGAPGSQTVTAGSSVTIPSQKPSKANTASSPYVVTFNGNEGRVDETSLTSYSRTGSLFNSWNTNSGGTGTTYNPGDSFTPSGNTTLYAQWSNTTARDTISMPSGSRNGYTLLGYGTTSSATTYVANPYTPTGDVTLYAIWGARTSTGWNVIHPIVRVNE